MKKHFGHTADQAIQSAFDPDKELLKVAVAPHEVNFSLNKDSDSIVSHKAFIFARINRDESVDVSGTSKVSVYGEPSSVVYVSPNGVDFIQFGTIPENHILTMDICTKAIKCNNSCDVVAV